MSQDIRDFVTPSCDLLALGEPTHWEQAFPRARNELFAQLVDHGFRSIALETDRVAALIVNDFVQEGVGTLDTVMGEGFSHDFGKLDANRHLIAWMREYNESRPPEDRLAFHGFDASTEMMNVPSPRRYLEYARDYLDLAGRVVQGQDAAHRRPRFAALPQAVRGTGAEPDHSGATLVFAHNRHLQRGQSILNLGEMEISFSSAGAIVRALSSEQYTFIVGSLGRSEALGVREPEADTYEGLLQREITTWGLSPAAAVTSGRTRTNTSTVYAYIPLDEATLEDAEAILHIYNGATALV